MTFCTNFAVFFFFFSNKLQTKIFFAVLTTTNRFKRREISHGRDRKVYIWSKTVYKRTAKRSYTTKHKKKYFFFVFCCCWNIFMKVLKKKLTNRNEMEIYLLLSRCCCCLTSCNVSVFNLYLMLLGRLSASNVHHKFINELRGAMRRECRVPMSK